MVITGLGRRTGLQSAIEQLHPRRKGYIVADDGGAATPEEHPLIDRHVASDLDSRRAKTAEFAIDIHEFPKHQKAFNVGRTRIKVSRNLSSMDKP